MKKMIIVMLVLLLGGCLWGCTGETAAMEIAKQTSSIAAATLMYAPIDTSSVGVDGEINNPHYRVQALWVTGLHLDIGLDGIQLKGKVTGTGKRTTELATEDRKFIQDFVAAEMNKGHPLAEAIANAFKALKERRNVPPE